MDSGISQNSELLGLGIVCEPFSDTEFNFINVKISDLNDFMKSNFFESLDSKPLSLARATSYLTNPWAESDDPILYLLYIDTRLVAYRTLLPDSFEGQKFAWCSGSWVHDDFRRLGLSSKLLERVFADWNNKLMFSNYAESARKLFQKTSKFSLLSSRNGFRFFLKFDLIKNFKDRVSKVLRPFLYCLEKVLKFYVNLSLFFFRKHKLNLDFSSFDSLNDEFLEVFDAREVKGLARKKTELMWIANNPWIDIKASIQNYFFSYSAKLFYYSYILIKNNNDIVGFMILQNRDSKLKLPYFQVEDVYLKEVAKYIVNYCAKNKVSDFTSWYDKLNKEIDNIRNPFLCKKKNIQNVYSSFIDSVDVIVSDGDGDYIFT